MWSTQYFLVNRTERKGKPYCSKDLLNKVTDYIDNSLPEKWECCYFYTGDKGPFEFEGKQYPNGIVRDPEAMKEIVKLAEKQQNGAMEFYLLKAYEAFGKTDSIFEMVHVAKEKGPMAWYPLRKLCELKQGIYSMDASFFDFDTYSCRIEEDTFKKIEERPDDYAIVVVEMR